jgi:hypothetical protein
VVDPWLSGAFIVLGACIAGAVAIVIGREGRETQQALAREAARREWRRGVINPMLERVTRRHKLYEDLWEALQWQRHEQALKLHHSRIGSASFRRTLGPHRIDDEVFRAACERFLEADTACDRAVLQAFVLIFPHGQPPVGLAVPEAQRPRAVSDSAAVVERELARVREELLRMDTAITDMYLAADRLLYTP